MDEIVTQLVENGYPRAIALEAVAADNVDSYDMALAWIMENFQSEEDEEEEGEEEKDFKMVMVVRMDLKMGKGKIAAQCCHACLGLYRQNYETAKDRFDDWLSSGSAKVVCKTKSVEDLEQLQLLCASKSIPSFIVYDAGRTQIPAGSATVIAVGPGLVEEIDSICAKFKLL